MTSLDEELERSVAVACGGRYMSPESLMTSSAFAKYTIFLSRSRVGLPSLYPAQLAASTPSLPRRRTSLPAAKRYFESSTPALKRHCLTA